MVNAFSRLGASFVIISLMGWFVSPYTRTIPLALAEKSISPINDSDTTSSLIQLPPNDPLIPYVEQYLVGKITSIEGQILQSSSGEKAKLESEKTFLELQIAIEQYDPDVIAAAKKLLSEKNNEANEIDRAVQEARTHLGKLEKTAKNAQALLVEVKAYIQILDQKNTNPAASSETERIISGIQRQIANQDYHEKYIPLRLNELQRQYDDIIRQINETNVNPMMHGRQKSAIIANLQKAIYPINDEKISLQLAQQKYRALKNGANEEDLYRLGLTDEQIAHFISIQQGNTQASVRQDQTIKQKIMEYKGAILGQAIPGALSSLNKQDLALSRSKSAAFEQRAAIPFATKNIVIEEKEIYGLSKRPANNDGKTQASSLPGGITYKAVIYRPSPEIVEKLRMALKDELQKQKMPLKNNEKIEKNNQDEMIKTLLDYITNKNPQENAKKIADMLKNNQDAKLFEKITVEGITSSENDQQKSYWERTVEQVILGNYSDEFTALGFAAEITVSLIGIDIPMDVRDLVYDVQHWQWSKNHAFNTALDAVAFLPVVGAIKKAKKIPDILESIAKLEKHLPNNIPSKTEGVYIYYNRKLGAHYVGQSGDISKRLQQHINAGNLDPEDLKEVEVIAIAGGKVKREIAEQFIIKYEYGGISDELANKINPLGEQRMDFMPKVPESK